MDDFKNRKTNDIGQVSAQELFPVIEELLAEGRQAAFTVTGTSMWPLLCHGRDQVVIEKCAPGCLRRGDIVLLRTPLGNYLLHRVTRITDREFETTGDGNCFRDGEFPFSCIRARAVRLVRKGLTIECHNGKYRVLSWIWMRLYLVRRWIFSLWFLTRKVIKR